MGKIPKNLSDKDMFKDYKEEESLEAKLLANVRAKEKKEEEAIAKEIASVADPALMRLLAHELMKLKLELFAQGVRDYETKVERSGNKIILSLEEK